MWSPWPGYSDGALLLTPNLQVYNAYTAFHENMGTLKSWSEGTAQPFFQARVLDFVFNYVVPTHNVDTNRVTLFGESMGGAGTHMWGIRSAHLFSNLLARVGHNIPAEDEHWVWQFEQVGGYGPLAWQTLYSNPQLTRFGYPEIQASDHITVWDYFDNRDWLRAHPTVETPHITYSNAPNDPAIGWAQAWEVTQALIETRRPFAFSWGQGGHGEPLTPLPISFERDQSLPAFTNGSLDDFVGSTPTNPWPMGQLNRRLRWDTETISDTVTGWAVDLYMAADAPGSSATVDVTPHRLQHFEIVPLAEYEWQLKELPQKHVAKALLLGIERPLIKQPRVVITGVVSADSDGLVTGSQVPLTKSPQRLLLHYSGDPPPPPPDYVIYIPIVVRDAGAPSNRAFFFSRLQR
jgi:hypothetical protein